MKSNLVGVGICAQQNLGKVNLKQLQSKSVEKEVAISFVRVRQLISGAWIWLKYFHKLIIHPQMSFKLEFITLRVEFSCDVCMCVDVISA
mmetsp:Transcript_40276/g.53033  ORF Transcript_40276/g.53033 Transcript_40276/m.53033 type:complete len:90 (+) Transcript_40276:492-761(+)